MSDTIYREVTDWFRSRAHHAHYHDPQQPAPEAPMSWLTDIQAEIAKAVTWTEDEFRAKLPTVAALADHAEAFAASAPAQAVLDAVLSPADEQWITGLVARLDQRVHNLQAGDPPQPAEPAPAQ